MLCLTFTHIHPYVYIDLGRLPACGPSIGPRRWKVAQVDHIQVWKQTCCYEHVPVCVIITGDSWGGGQRKAGVTRVYPCGTSRSQLHLQSHTAQLSSDWQPAWKPSVNPSATRLTPTASHDWPLPFWTHSPSVGLTSWPLRACRVHLVVV